MKTNLPGSQMLVRLLDRDKLAASIKSGTRLLIGVSGGADSVALLCAMTVIVPQAKIELGVVHVNHGLRTEADADEKFVVDLCAQLDIPCYVYRLGSDAAMPSDGSAEAHWRRLRYEQFITVLRKENYDAIALGHTADDLAETFLFHLARGTGVDGLSFTFESKRHGVRIIRPLWKTQRADIESALRAIDQTWVDDPSNQNTRHRRNLIRHKIMPLLREINPDATAAIVRASEAISQECQPSSCRITPDASTSNFALSNFPDHTLPVMQFLRPDFPREQIPPTIRRFIAYCGARATSRQIDQSYRMIIAENSGTVALSNSTTLVITRQFAWIIQRREPSTAVLAAEHTRRFGGLVANLGWGIRMIPVQRHPDGSVPELPSQPIENPTDGDFIATEPARREFRPESFPQKSDDAFMHYLNILALDGKVWQVIIENALPNTILTNRAMAVHAGNTPIKKILNQHRVPWYLRDWMVFVVGSSDRGVFEVLNADDKLTQTIQRHSRSNLKISVRML